MKLKTKVVTSVLAGAMLALPFVTAPAFAEAANSVNSNYVQRVDWWDPLESTCRHASLSIL